MRVKFHPLAQREAQRATTYYNRISKHLGVEFRQELEEAVTRITQAPTAWHLMEKNYRRCPLHRFPFGIIYRINEQRNEYQIFAIMHFRRKPGYWVSHKF